MKNFLQLEEVLNNFGDGNMAYLKKCGHTYKNDDCWSNFGQNNITQTIIELTQQLLMGKKSFEVQPIAAQG